MPGNITLKKLYTLFVFFAFINVLTLASCGGSGGGGGSANGNRNGAYTNQTFGASATSGALTVIL